MWYNRQMDEGVERPPRFESDATRVEVAHITPFELEFNLFPTSDKPVLSEGAECGHFVVVLFVCVILKKATCFCLSSERVSSVCSVLPYYIQNTKVSVLLHS